MKKLCVLAMVFCCLSIRAMDDNFDTILPSCQEDENRPVIRINKAKERLIRKGYNILVPVYEAPQKKGLGLPFLENVLPKQWVLAAENIPWFGKSEKESKNDKDSLHKSEREIIIEKNKAANVKIIEGAHEKALEVKKSLDLLKGKLDSSLFTQIEALVGDALTVPTKKEEDDMEAYNSLVDVIDSVKEVVPSEVRQNLGFLQAGVKSIKSLQVQGKICGIPAQVFQIAASAGTLGISCLVVIGYLYTAFIK